VADEYGPDWVYQDKPVRHTDLTFRLVKDLPIQGRILDLEGKPVKGATLWVEHIEAYADTEAFLQTVRAREWPLIGVRGLSGPCPGQAQTLATGADGRFRLDGVGQDRLVQFQLQGPSIAHRPVRALARELTAAVEPRKQKSPYGPVILPVHGATFDVVA